MTVPVCRRCGHEVVTDGPRCPYCGQLDPTRLDTRQMFKAEARVSLFALVVCGLVLLFFTLLAGCRNLDCTQAGCGHTVQVTVLGLERDALVELEAVGGEVRTAPCNVEPDGSCLTDFYDFAPETITVTVVEGLGLGHVESGVRGVLAERRGMRTDVPDHGDRHPAAARGRRVGVLAHADDSHTPRLKHGPARPHDTGMPRGHCHSLRP